MRARRSKWDAWFGRVNDWGDYFLMIGKKIADIGIEGAEERIINETEFAAIQVDVMRKLKEAVFAAEPRLILKLEARYRYKERAEPFSRANVMNHALCTRHH